jgi:hypothetical protein
VPRIRSTRRSTVITKRLKRILVRRLSNLSDVEKCNSILGIFQPADPEPTLLPVFGQHTGILEEFSAP